MSEANEYQVGGEYKANPSKANEYQVGGSHYKSMRVEPWDVIDGCFTNQYERPFF